MRCFTPKITAIFVIIFIISTANIFAHGELTARINEKTTQIKKDPNNPLLYFKRGVLYYQHNEYENAIKDYEKAEVLGFKEKQLYYSKAESLRNLEKYDEGLIAIQHYDLIDNTNVKARKLKGQLLVGANRYSEAFVCFDYVIKTKPDLSPADITEYSNAILKENPNNYKEAIRIIDLGLNKIGEQTISLIINKISYLKSSNRNNEALSYYNDLIIKSNRKESWYYEKALLLYKINRQEEAMVAVQQSKMALLNLSSKFQQTGQIKTLRNKIEKLEQTLLE